eukprot:s738_g29.t1
MSKWYEAGVTRGSAPTMDVGDTLELRVYDDSGNEQGTILIGVLEKLGKHRDGPILAGMFLGASDIYYHWWMNEGPNAPAKDRGIYHLCGEATSKCPVHKKYPDMVHSDRYRNLGTSPLTSKRVPWLKDNTLFTAYEFCHKKFRGVCGDGSPRETAMKKPRAEAELPWPEENDPSDKEEGDEADEDSGDDETESDDPTMKAKIKKLRQELKRAEEDAAEGRKKRQQKKKKRQTKKSGVTRSVRLEIEKADKGKKEKEKHKEKKRKDKDERKEKRRRRDDSDDEAQPSGSKPKKKARQEESDPDETGDESDGQDAELFKVKKVPTSGKKDGDQDRGPFGGGEPVKFPGGDDESSDTESDFHKGLTSTVKSSQQRLLAYTNRFPGRLASRLLMKMQTATARDGVRPTSARSGRTPPVAMNHILTVLLPSLGSKAGLRSIRELKTLGGILDHLAAGSLSRAADVVSQRIKAVERATHEGHWGAAQFLELLPPENSMLLERDEEMYLAKEYLMDQRLKTYDRQQSRPEGGGKGKSKKAKGKTKEKGDKGTWDKNDKVPKKPEVK